MADRDTGRTQEHRQAQDDAGEPEGLGDKLRALADRIGCAANAPLENLEAQEKGPD